MPDVKVYIRAEDLDKWSAVEKKAEFIHNALNPVTAEDVADISSSGRVKLYDKVQPIKTSTGLIYDTNIGPKLCKHGADPKLCKFAKNGKVCK